MSVLIFAVIGLIGGMLSIIPGIRNNASRRILQEVVDSEKSVSSDPQYSQIREVAVKKMRDEVDRWTPALGLCLTWGACLTLIGLLGTVGLAAMDEFGAPPTKDTVGSPPLAHLLKIGLNEIPALTHCPEISINADALPDNTHPVGRERLEQHQCLSL